ncbi:MAG: GNAT family N-acetyltransferase [Ignavibacteria bacterium]|nr:GNAT family N-acetyltransferase [Ignavibacteria bacterium]MBI3765925.1 GNAT family N-acetyltransferase [Ignavibacteriales bacterium]
MKAETEIMPILDEIPNYSAERNDKGPCLMTEVVDTVETFTSLRDEWDTLAQSSSATIYQTHEWLWLWWKHYGNQTNQKLQIVLFRSEETLIGIAPMFVENDSIIGIRFSSKLKMLGSGTAYSGSFGLFFDDGPSDYLDILALPGTEAEVSRALVDYLKHNSRLFNEIEFVNAADGSIVRQHIAPQLEAGGFSCRVTRADVCPELAVPSSLDKYLQNVSSSVRRRLNQAQRASGEGFYTILNVQTHEDYRKALDDIIELHQQRWNRLGYPGLFADRRFRAFQKDVVNAFYHRGWLWCKTANVNGSCVAGRLAFNFNSTLYDYLSGFDDTVAAAKRRPGLALLITMIQDAITGNFQKIDFLRGDEQYKFELTSDAKYNWNISVMHSPTINPLHQLLRRTVRGMQFGRFLLAREFRLLVVQSRRHSFPKFFAEYIRFRMPRLNRKVGSLIGKNPDVERENREQAGEFQKVNRSQHN